MSLVCFASQKGAPGCTLAALATAAAWPTTDGRRKLFVEADPDGGVLAVRYGLGLEPGLVTMAAATRAGAGAAAVFDHAQELPGGLAAVPCPDHPDQARAALDAAADGLAELLTNAPGLDVIVDVGRLHGDSPAMSLVRAADIVLMVSSRGAESLQPSARRMSTLEPETAALGWVLVGDGPHTAEEIQGAYGFPVVARIPTDVRAARALEGTGPTRRLRRTPLVRAAATLATNLDGLLNPNTDAAPTSAAGPDPDRTDRARDDLPDVFADRDDQTVEPTP